MILEGSTILQFPPSKYWGERAPPPVPKPMICEVPSPGPLGSSCRGTQIFIHQFMECIDMRISQPNYEKSVGKGHFFERVILAGTPEWRAPCEWVLPQPGCPRVCPPWAHRSYFTVLVPLLSPDPQLNQSTFHIPKWWILRELPCKLKAFWGILIIRQRGCWQKSCFRPGFRRSTTATLIINLVIMIIDVINRLSQRFDQWYSRFAHCPDDVFSNGCVNQNRVHFVVFPRLFVRRG